MCEWCGQSQLGFEFWINEYNLTTDWTPFLNKTWQVSGFLFIASNRGLVVRILWFYVSASEFWAFNVLNIPVVWWSNGWMRWGQRESVHICTKESANVLSFQSLIIYWSGYVLTTIIQLVLSLSNGSFCSNVI